MPGNLLTDMSDHFANLFVLYSNKKNDNKEKRPMVRLFSEKNKQKCQNILKQINWKKELSGKKTNEAMQIFYKELSIAYNKAFPYVRLSRKRASARTSDYQCHCGYHGITSVTIASKFLPLFCQSYHSTILPMTLVKYW